MSWAIGFDSRTDRDIGYGVPATCDYPGCNERINRGLAYVCGNEPFGGDHGCGLYFCSNHHREDLYPDNDPDQGGDPLAHSLCERCAKGGQSFDPKPDVQEWIDWKMTDGSWAEWRAENSAFVAAHPTRGE